MTKEQYDDIHRRLTNIMMEASVTSELLRYARCGVLADKVLSICTDAGSHMTKWEQIEPDWNAPDTSDCHTHS